MSEIKKKTKKQEIMEEVINFLGQKGFPEKFAQKVLHFAEVNEEVKG